ncbi:MAG: hypothetical protein HYV29_14255 [Ignavibacteriales bacterium]|nr:hypothetical protein [Ignavibacteriales bacterium]
MKDLVFAFITAMLFVGCTSSYIVSPLGRENSISYEEFNGKARGETNRIQMVNGQQTEGRNVQVSSDSVLWLDERTGKTFGARIDEVKMVIRRDNWFGALEGFGFGLFTGGASGAILSIGEHSSFLGDTYLWAYYAIGLGVPGGVLGAIIGGAIGDTYNYQFVERTDNAKK